MLDERALEATASALRDRVLNRNGRGLPWEKLRQKIKDQWIDEVRFSVETYEQNRRRE